MYKSQRKSFLRLTARCRGRQCWCYECGATDRAIDVGLCIHAARQDHVHGPRLLYMVKSPSWPVDRFRELIDHILRETGLPQVQLAALVPMDQSQISRWKAGTSKPKPESLYALGSALADRFPHVGIGPSDLIAAVYPRETAIDATLPALQGNAGGAINDAPQPAPALPPELSEIKDPSPLESVLLAHLANLQEELKAVNARLDEQSVKLDALAAENGPGQADPGNDAHGLKSA